VNLLVGASGGIACYRACELCSLAIKGGHQVRVVMSANAQRFVGSTTFAGLTGHPVLVDTFADAMAHIEWAKWADAMVVAPASANLVGKLACGLADDVLATVTMAIPRGRPVVLAPAMNTEMWFHPVVQRNLEWLADLGRYTIVEPTEKRLACGDVGKGGLAEPADILAAVEAQVDPAPGSGS
jgi:phosphopantothenoylcysteine decarboxylase/phosphopantothenate--cysteine ligase